MNTDKTTPQWRKVRVFVSSPFTDMHAERDYLIKRVFPELQDWCTRRRLRLLDIDLRWGVSEEDAIHNKKVVSVCLSHIDDCRPFFLNFLGQRRGQVPKRSEVSNETFTSFPDLKPLIGTTSLTEMEILHASICPFHASLFRDADKSAEYYEPARHSFFYLRDPAYFSQLARDPPMLREFYSNEGVQSLEERDHHDGMLTKWREENIPALKRPFTTMKPAGIRMSQRPS